MIRNGEPGDRVTIPSWPTRKAGTITQIRNLRSSRATIIVVATDGGETRYMHPADVDPERIPARNRRQSTGTPSRR